MRERSQRPIPPHERPMVVEGGAPDKLSCRTEAFEAAQSPIGIEADSLDQNPTAAEPIDHEAIAVPARGAEIEPRDQAR